MASFLPSLLVIGCCTIQWFFIGYSLAYGKGSGVIGDLKWFMHRGVLADPVGTIPAVLFSEFQLVFEATVCAIAVGGACERGRVRAVVPFIFVSLVTGIEDWGLTLYSYGRLLFTARWLIWYGLKLDSWEILEFLILRAGHQFIFAVEHRQRRFRFTSLTLSSGLRSHLLEHLLI